MTALNNLTAVKLEFFDRLVCDPRVRGADCRVAWRLVCRSNDDLTSCPTCRTIARELECSVRTVRRSVDRLCAFGWFYKVTGRGRSKSNDFRLKTENRPTMSPFTEPA